MQGRVESRGAGALQGVERIAAVQIAESKTGRADDWFGLGGTRCVGG